MEKTYELCVLFGGNQTDAEIEKQANEVAEFLKAGSAAITFATGLGKRKLAYTLGGHTTGEYRVWYFTAASELVPAIDNKLRLSSIVARHLLANLPPTVAESRIAAIREGKSTVAEAEPRAPSRKRTGERTPEAGKTETIERRAEPPREAKKTSLEDLDKKLDEILESDKL